MSNSYHKIEKIEEQLMGNLLKIGGGVIFGVILTAIIGWNVMPMMMVNVTESPYGSEETVAKIKRNVDATEGWAISAVRPAHKNLKKMVGGEIPPTYLIDLCDPSYAYDVLKNDADRKLSLFMPCTISVYEKSDGKTYVATMNALLLGKMFGGNVAVVMEKVDIDQNNFIAFTSE